MPSSKKLTLSPLPEQRDDYSQYEESVVRWDRIVIVGLLGLVALVVLISLVSGDPVPDTVEEQPTNIIEPLVSQVANRESATQQAEEVDPVLALPTVEREASEKVVDAESRGQDLMAEQIPVSPQSKANTQDNPSETLSRASAPKPDSKLEVGDVISETSVPEVESDPKLGFVANNANESQLKPASILITNSAIKDAALNLSTDKGLPGALVEHSVIMPASGLIKVMLSTEMHGLRGQRLYHEWYRNGERQARVTIPVNVAKQKSHSSKFIDKHMLGTWQVKVSDSTGEPYLMADFEVIRAE